MNDGIINKGIRLCLLQNLAIDRIRNKQKQGVTGKIVVNCWKLLEKYC